MTQQHIQFDPSSLDNWAGRITSKVDSFAQTLDYHTEALREQNGNYHDMARRVEKLEAFCVTHGEEHQHKEYKRAERSRRRNRWLLILGATLLTFFFTVASLALERYLI